MIENSVGLEAEFFLRNEKNELVFPSEHGLPHDDFPILGEIRGAPGKKREETISNFLNEYYRISYLAEKKNLKLDIAEGWTKVDAKFYSTIVKKRGTKSVSKAENIHDHDLVGYSDSILKDGQILAQKVSTGLHIHFNSVEKDSKEFKKNKYESVNLPLQVSGVQTCLNLFAERGEEKVKVEVQCSRITNPVIRHIVQRMDAEVYTEFRLKEPLKYRLPGFYEKKEKGRFEYRSLPFNEKVMKALPKIVDFSFGLLEGL